MESGGGTRTKGCDVIGAPCNATFLQGSSSLLLSGLLTKSGQVTEHLLWTGKDMLSYQVALYGPSVISSSCTLTASWLDRLWNLRLFFILS